MCQHYEGEKISVIRDEIETNIQKYEAHVAGVAPLTDDELQELVVRQIMLRDAL